MTIRLPRIALSFGLFAALASPALGQDKPQALINPVAPAGGPAAPAPAGPLDLDGLLDALDARGQNLDSFTADIALTESDVRALKTTKTGKVWYQRLPDGNVRFRVAFVDVADEKTKRAEQVDYVLDKGWLVERNHRIKTQVRRQVLKPGQKLNLLKLGEGPFPLPIGQKKEEVKQQFEAELIKPRKGDPADAQHLELRPKETSALKRKFSSVNVWVDQKTRMPVRVDTLDRKEENEQSTVLSNLVVNPKLGDADFALPPVELGDWNVQEKKLEE